MLKPSTTKSFNEYAQPYILLKPHQATSLDMVWNCYNTDAKGKSKNQAQKRGKKMSGGWFNNPRELGQLLQSWQEQDRAVQLPPWLIPACKQGAGHHWRRWCLQQATTHRHRILGSLQPQWSRLLAWCCMPPTLLTIATRRHRCCCQGIGSDILPGGGTWNVGVLRHR